MKICIDIPVYNEAKNIGDVLDSLKKKNLDVVVIDDGSSDGSGAIAKAKGARVISHQRRSGKGASLRDGFRLSVDEAYAGVIVMDGDGQHDAEDIDLFLSKAKENSECVITGNRMQNHKGMPFVRYAVNKAMSMMISAACKQNIPDTQCGFRYIATRVLKEINLSSSDYEIETEVLMKASKKGFKVFSIPIKTIYGNESSKINPFKDTVRFFSYMIREMWGTKT